jgi:hypothetical protein
MISRLRSVFLLPVALAMSASLSMAQTGTLTRIEQDNPSVTYSGNWYTNGSAGNSGGGAALTNSAGSRASVNFTGTAISWLGVMDPWNGLATVTIDGQPARVDSFGAMTTYQAVLFSVGGLSIGPHTLTIEVTHERGPNGRGSWVWIDAFDVSDGAGVTGTPTAVGRLEEGDPSLIYTGIWYSHVSGMHSGGSAALAVGVGSAVTLNFNGTGVAWVTYRDQWSGIARVFLDGELKAEIDTYLSPSLPHTAPYQVQGLPPGNHTLTIEVTGTHNESAAGAWVWVDAFDVAG